MKIIPTIFAHNKKDFQKRFQKLLPIAKNFQIDFMDGKFVPAKSVSISQIPDLKKFKKNFEAHLMIKNPARQIFILKEKGFSKIIFHVESYKTKKMIEKTIFSIKKNKMEAWLAINPDTPIKKILNYLDKIEGVLFMGVRPGKEHQRFIPEVYEKISALRKINKKIPIQIDGGITPEVLKKIYFLKVSYVNSGSFIANSENPKKALKNLLDYCK